MVATRRGGVPQIAVMVALAIGSGALAQTVTVTSPNGGEVWSAGSPQTVQWTYTGPSAVFKIELWRDSQFYDTLGLAEPSRRSFAWPICTTIGDSAAYTVRVACAGCTGGGDFSDAAFQIVGSEPRPAFVLTAPASGAALSAGTTVPITWTSTNPRGGVSAWLLRDGLRVAYLGSTPMAEGQLPWDIDPWLDPTGSYAIELRSLETCGPSDPALSSGPLAIVAARPKPALAITSPNGGEIVAAGSNRLITWTVTAPAGEVELWLIDSGGQHEPIGTAPAAAGEFTWPVLTCTPAGNDRRILARWSTGPESATDASDGAFSITAAATPVLQVTSPADGQVIQAGQQMSIAWTSSTLLGDVDIALIAPTGVLYVGNAAAGGSPIQWTVPMSLEGASGYRVLVTLRTCGEVATSASFTVAGGLTPTLALTGPSAGSVFASGDVVPVTWASSGLTGDVHLFLPSNMLHHSGHAVVPIETGRFLWTVPRDLTWGADPQFGHPGGAILLYGDRWPVLFAKGDDFDVVPAAGLAGDLDADGDVDLRDAARLQASFTGRGPDMLSPACDALDVEPDGDVDQDDAAAVLGGMAGPSAEGV